MNNQDAVRAPFLRVTAPNVADAVRSAGGLMFDRARLGWRVIVSVSEDQDTRALRVLGAEVDQPTDDPLPASSRPADSRDGPTALTAESTEVTVWGAALPVDNDSSVVSYRLSRAAQVFKAQALIAAGLAESVEPTETFSTPCPPHLIASDLTVAG